MSLNKLSLAGNNYLFLARISLVSGIPAGYGKMAKLFFTLQPLPICERIVKKSFLSFCYIYILTIRFSCSARKIHGKIRFATFPSLVGMSLTKLSLDGNS